MKHGYDDLTAFHDSVARYDALPPGQRPAWNYQQWTPAESLEGASYLRTTLHQNPGARMRAYLGLIDDQGEELVTLWLVVVDEGGAILGGFNESFPCPPRCG